MNISVNIVVTRLHSLSVRTLGFHPGRRGSTPLGAIRDGLAICMVDTLGVVRTNVDGSNPSCSTFMGH